jgi:4-amino-4-deoxy-L-arabinose transferase-like glycosyltransferase
MHFGDKIKKLIDFCRTIDLYFVSILLVAAVLRFIDLGYSDYQGDETKAFYYPTQGQSFVQFLMEQRKGPLQFMVTAGTKFISQEYSNNFIARLPFALAGFFAVYFFYKFVKMHFGRRAAFFSGFLFAVNGFLIAFSRIVQYQSLVIFFMVLALYLFSISSSNPKYKFWGLFGALVSWALSILAHYDGIFIAPFMLFLLIRWFKAYYHENPKNTILTFIAAALLPIFLILAFYLPYFLSIASDTLKYWEGRISGSVSGKISSSKYLFRVYQPIYVIHIYAALSALGFVYILYRAIVERRLSADYVFLLLWVAAPLAFMEFFVSVPGTHIYTYLIPLTIVLSLGLILIQKIVYLIFKERFGAVIFQTCVTYVFLFMFAQMYAIYVDNYREYPWESEKFLFWELHQPTPTYHLSLFGFPYNRNWDGVKKYIESFPEITAYSGNERTALSRYYIKLQKDANIAGFYIYIRNPQTLTNDITHEKVLYWMNNHEPLYVYSKNGQDLTSIYLMPPIKLDEIIELEHPDAPANK